MKCVEQIDVRRQGLNPTIYEAPGTITDITRSDAVTYRFGGSYRTNEWLTLRANIGTGFRAPSPNELNGEGFIGNGIRIIGNPNLKNEKALGWEIGATATRGAVRGEVT